MHRLNEPLHTFEFVLKIVPLLLDLETWQIVYVQKELSFDQFMIKIVHVCPLRRKNTVLTNRKQYDFFEVYRKLWRYSKYVITVVVHVILL